MNSMDREGGLLGLFRNKAVLACLTALCLACGGCASQPEDISPLDADGLIVLTIGTADTGGTMTPVGTAIAQVLSTDQLKFNISTSTGSFMNIQNHSSGEIDLGLVAATPPIPLSTARRTAPPLMKTCGPLPLSFPAPPTGCPPFAPARFMSMT